MLRELFTIPGVNFTIYGYGLMLVLACLGAIWLAKALAKRCGLNPEHFVNLGVLALVSGVLGARLVHVLQNWHDYTGGSFVNNLVHMINLREGGLVYYGGVLLATPACIVYGLYHKIPILRGMDIIAPCLMIGLGVGRIGCFMNGCCYGDHCSLPWAVKFPYGSPPYEEQVMEGQMLPPSQLVVPGTYDPLTGKRLTEPHLRTRAELNTLALQAAAAQTKSLAVHPVQLYSTFTALLIAGICVAYFTTNPLSGQVFALMMILEGFGRFTLENLRVEPPVVHLGQFAWSLSMLIGVCLVFAGAMLLPALTLVKRQSARGFPVTFPST